MGFFDSLSDLWEAATPWSQGEAEAVSGGASEEKTPAQNDDGGEGEAKVCSIYLYDRIECSNGVWNEVFGIGATVGRM